MEEVTIYARVFYKDTPFFSNEKFYYWEDIKDELNLDFEVSLFIPPGYIDQVENIIGVCKPGIDSLGYNIKKKIIIKEY